MQCSACLLGAYLPTYLCGFKYGRYLYYVHGEVKYPGIQPLEELAQRHPISIIATCHRPITPGPHTLIDLTNIQSVTIVCDPMSPDKSSEETFASIPFL